VRTTSLRFAIIALVGFVMSAVGQAQTVPTDVYHVMFVKALPGQAAALAKQLQQPQNPKDPMAGHFVLLRHQEGDDWDYCLVNHLGPRATVEITPPDTNTPMQAWHGDTFVAGPSWGEFSKLMNGPPSSVYIVSTHRVAPGRRTQLFAILNRAPTAKVPISQTILVHLEGGPWQFLSLVRYNSWQDLATHRAAASTSDEGWLEVRQNSAFHVDTIADRIAPK
jgi:hypothetical protein